MARKTITRTIQTSLISGFAISMVNDEPVTKKLDSVSVVGKVSHKDAMKILKEKAPESEVVTVSKIEVSENTYKLNLEDFIKYGEKIETKNDADTDTANKN